jgi:hypothetical protein
MSSNSDSSPSGHHSTDQDQDQDQDQDTVEAHYASLERGIPCYCYGSGVVVLTIEEDGQEFDVVVPCRRCVDSR